MIHILLSRLRQGHRTQPFPKILPSLPERFRGRPELRAGACPEGCRVCAEVCPSSAIAMGPGGPALDLGRCLFCPECADACLEQALRFTGDHAMAVRARADLVLVAGAELQLAGQLEAAALRLFGHSLKLRVVSAGGCNGCEVDVNVLGTVAWDLGRFGIQFVASPRHADALLICGPVTAHMELAVLKTYEAMAKPKLVIAVGACALSGGPFRQQDEQLGGVASRLPVDLFIPGCPPHPLTLLDGLLRLLGQAPSAAGTASSAP